MLQQHICEYGCGKGAKYRFKNGKYCCNSNWHLCPHQRMLSSSSRKGEKNYWYGKKHSEESKRKDSESHKGEKNYMWGKTHSEETKKKNSEAHKGEKNPQWGKPRTKETKKLLSEKSKHWWSIPGNRESRKGEKHPFWGKTHSEEAKEKNRLAHLGKKHSEEHIRKVSEANRGEKNYWYGKKRSEKTIKEMSEKRRLWWSVPENRNKMSKVHKGEKHSEEHIRKVSEANKGKIRSEETKILMSEKRKKWWKNNPESREKYRQYMLNGGAIHANSFVKNPSEPQVELFELTKRLYPEAILNYPIFEFNRSIDVCIPNLKIAIEYDEPYWHQDKLADEIRQTELETLGYRFIRYERRIPSLRELTEDIEKFTKENLV